MSYLGKTLTNNKATFSQFLRLEQNIRHESFGITSITKPPILSGSNIAICSEYFITKLLIYYLIYYLLYYLLTKNLMK